MNHSEIEKWFLEVNEEQNEYSSIEEILTAFKNIEGLSSCRVWAGKDGGVRPWWHRLFGSQKRFVDSLFSLEWHQDIAYLIFSDENWSEYRAIDKEYVVSASETDRLKVAHGELVVPSNDECIQKHRAIKAIREFLQSNKRPKWLTYKYVE